MAQQFKVKNGLIVDSGGIQVTGSISSTGGFTGSFSGTATSASYALSASYAPIVIPFPHTGSAIITGSLVVTGSVTSTGTIVAQTLVVQTITSSVEFVTGSNRFGSTTGNTHEFTGSLLVSGSQTVNGSSTVGNVLQVNGVSTNAVIQTNNDNNILVLVSSNALVDNKPRIELGGTGYSIANTNFYRAATQIFTSAYASTEYMRITSAGYVGIGTTNPSDLLTVVGTGLYPRITIQSTNAGSSSAGVNFADSSGIQWAIAYDKSGGGMQFFREGSGNRMYINNAGYVGIGTIPGSWNTIKAIEIGHTGNFYSGFDGGSAIYMGNGAYYNTGWKYAFTGTAVSLADFGQSAFTFYRAGSGTAGNAISFTATMALTSNGYVGIGTTSPAGKFQVNLPAYTNEDADANHAIFGSGTSGYGVRIGYGESANSGYINVLKPGVAWSNFYIQTATTTFVTSGTTRAVINGSGLSVTGAITATGDVTAYSSDKRLKENVVNIPSALDKILSLNGVTYDWNKKALDFGFVPDNRKHDVGLLAQEVQSVLPEAIAPAPFDTDSTTGESISGENYLTVRYEKLVALLVEGMKEQQTQINELK